MSSRNEIKNIIWVIEIILLNRISTVLSHENIIQNIYRKLDHSDTHYIF